MKTVVTIVKEFIKDNHLSFSGTGSDLNGNCVILAGFICYNVEEISKGYDIINKLPLSELAYNELSRIFDYAYFHEYGEWWKTPEAKETYKF